MARGLGGDDGPSVWMFLACILIWGKVQGWFNSVKEDLSGNLANPFQAETTADIRKMEKKIKNTPFSSSALRKPRTHYEEIADAQHKEMTSSFNIDEDRLYQMLELLNVDELKAVYVSFGARDSTALGITAWTGDIFKWYQHLLTDSTFGGNDLSDMRALWKKTGLWHSL